MDEHLVDYLLESLDPVTHHRVEGHLRQHPEARAKLDLLRQAMAPLAEDVGDPDPPPGLALRALARVAEYRCALPTAPPPSPGERTAGSWRGLGRAEWAVAACLLLLIGGLAVPAIAQGQRRYQRVACANNLHRFHTNFNVFADLNERGEFPRVEEHGPHAIAGIFVPTLTDRGLAQDVSIDCPAQGRRSPLPYSLDELATMARNDPARFEAVASQLAGQYAYCLGYEQGGRLCGLRRNSGDLLPIMADCAGHGLNSDNHGGRGQNVLYVGGQVRWCELPTVGENNDHVFVSHNNRVEAGVRRSDTVLGSSAARPFAGQ